MRTEWTKRDQRFRRSLPALDWRLGVADIGPYLGKGGDIRRAPAENWRYPLYHALRMTRYALGMAYTNQHHDVRDKPTRLFVRQCWFVLAVLSLQAAADKLAKLVRDRLRVTHWERRGKRPIPVTERNTNLARVERHLMATGRASRADHQLWAFMHESEAKGIYDLANAIKHGETLAWKGFESVPVVEVDGPGSLARTRDDVEPIVAIEDEEVMPGGRTGRTTLSYGQRAPRDLDAEVKKVARVYGAFVPVAEAVVREYLDGPHTLP